VAQFHSPALLEKEKPMLVLLSFFIVIVLLVAICFFIDFLIKNDIDVGEGILVAILLIGVLIALTAIIHIILQAIFN
jgi:hypothetical protein